MVTLSSQPRGIYRGIGRWERSDSTVKDTSGDGVKVDLDPLPSPHQPTIPASGQTIPRRNGG